METRWINKRTGHVVTRIGTLLPKTRKVLVRDHTGATFTMNVAQFRHDYVEAYKD